MQRRDFYYELPSELIAHRPLAERSGSRLLQLDGVTGQQSHHVFSDITGMLDSGDLLVFNDTRVIPARVFGTKASGGKVEILVERVLGPDRVVAHVRSSKSPKPGSEIILEDGTVAIMEKREDSLFYLNFPKDKPVLETLESIGHMPLPPYIDRPDNDEDKERYQTVYGKNKGAVAAPTAGLHFDQSLLDALTTKGIDFAYVTLHVGAGTFQPVRVDDIRQHTMHKEVMELNANTCEQIKNTRHRGNRVVAVGTTSVRCLETAAQSGDIAPYQGETNIFIYPSYQYRVVDALITNFHLPESTLLMLVAAFAGYKNIMAAYETAVNLKYRFFSYGDAMFMTKNPQAHCHEI